MPPPAGRTPLLFHQISIADDATTLRHSNSPGMSPLRSGEPRTDELLHESVDGDAGTSYFEFLEKSAGWNRGRGLLGTGHIVDLAAQTLGAIHRCSNVNWKGSLSSPVSTASACDGWSTAASKAGSKLCPLCSRTPHVPASPPTGTAFSRPRPRDRTGDVLCSTGPPPGSSRLRTVSGRLHTSLPFMVGASRRSLPP